MKSFYKPLLYSLLLGTTMSILSVATAVADGGHGDETATSISAGGAAPPIVALLSVTFIVSAIFFASEGLLNRNDLIGVVLGVITGAIHLYYGLNGDMLLLLNGSGYFVLLVAAFIPIEGLASFRKQFQILLGLYTLATIVGYFVTHMPAQMSRVGIFTKIVEVLFIGVLILAIRDSKS